MDNGVRLIIYKNKSVYDDIFVARNFVCTFDEYSEKVNSESREVNPIIIRKKGFSAYLVSIYIYSILNSKTFRHNVIDALTRFQRTNIDINESSPTFLLKLQTPKYQFLDYTWNDKINRMLMLRQHIDIGLSWLSTLGGAFSSLGDEFDNCAKIAGQISLEQFKLSLQLQDPQLTARCRLYLALSLLQQRHLKVTKRMVQNVYRFAVKDNDIRLQKMCHGVWAKLKYYYSIKNEGTKVQDYKNLVWTK